MPRDFSAQAEKKRLQAKRCRELADIVENRDARLMLEEYIALAS